MRGTAKQRKATEEVERAGQTELVRKRLGKRPSARDSEGGKEWSRKGPREAQREIERGQRNREPKSFERVRGSGRAGLWRRERRSERGRRRR